MIGDGLFLFFYENNILPSCGPSPLPLEIGPYSVLNGLLKNSGSFLTLAVLNGCISGLYYCLIRPAGFLSFSVSIVRHLRLIEINFFK
jgi:hypothetical protein